MINMFIGLGIMFSTIGLVFALSWAWDALDRAMWRRRERKQPSAHFHSLGQGVSFPCTDNRCLERKNR